MLKSFISYTLPKMIRFPLNKDQNVQISEAGSLLCLAVQIFL